MEQEEIKKVQAEDVIRAFADTVQSVRTYAGNKTDNLEAQFKTALSETEGDVTRALDILLYSNPSLRAEYNRNYAEKGQEIGYDLLARELDDKEYMAGTLAYENRALDTASNPGGANIIQTTLSDTILYKAEQLGQIIAILGKDDIPYGDKEYPRITAKAVATFIDEDTTGWTDLSATTYEAATTGLTKVKHTPRDFGLKMTYTNRMLEKVTPATIAFFRKYEAEGLARGIEQQALRGNGAGQNATGIVAIATSIAFNGNAYLTLNDAVGTLSTTDTENIKAVMHRKTWQEFKKLRVVSMAYRDGINTVTPMIDDIPVILSNNADASVATVGNVIVGDFEHYLYTKTGGIKTLVDVYTNAGTRQTNVYDTMLIDLGAWQPNSFATFTVTF